MTHENKSSGILSIIKALFDEPLPKGVGWAHTFGSVLLALIAVQLLTGILLSFYYSPNADAAYESVKYIEEQVLFGSLIRGVHYFAASAMVIMIFLHMARTFFSGAYKPPRQWTWVAGVGLLLLVLGFAFTGYLLPWDMKAYFATKVGINIGGIAPIFGEQAVKILKGGSEMSTITLSRFFSLHVIVLPLTLLLVVGLHLFYIRQHGETPPGLRNDERPTYSSRFYPQQLFRDSLVVFLVVAMVLVLAAKFGAPLEAKADPNDTSYMPRPDWYFYSLFQLLKLFPGRLEIIGAIIIPGAFFTLLVLLPFFDKNPERRLSQRPVARSVGAAVLASVILLTAWGAWEGEQAQELIADEGKATVEGEVESIFVVDANAGRALYQQLKCGECHNMTSRGNNIPPGLEFAGNKYRPAWLLSYLRDPYRIRWQSKNERPVVRMPDFDLSEEEALNISAYLMALRKDVTFSQPEFDWAEADSDMVASGTELVFEYGCSGCHKIGNDGQNIAPELTHVGNKLLESYLYNLIKSPQRIIPETSMKNFQLDDVDVEDIVAYLRTLE